MVWSGLFWFGMAVQGDGKRRETRAGGSMMRDMTRHAKSVFFSSSPLFFFPADPGSWSPVVTYDTRVTLCTSFYRSVELLRFGLVWLRRETETDRETEGGGAKKLREPRDDVRKMNKYDDSAVKIDQNGF